MLDREIAGRSDWQSPLYFALAPLALLRPGSRRLAVALWGFAAYLFLTWWLLTHRLDRFWLPMLPVLAVLAGLGGRLVPATGLVISAGTRSLSWRSCRTWSTTSTALAGFNEWTGDLTPPRLAGAAQSTLAADGDADLPPDAASPAGRPGGRLPPRPSDHLQHGVQSRDDRGLARGPTRRLSPGASRPGGDAHLRRLEGDRATSAAGRLWLHRLRDARAIRGRVAAGVLTVPSDRGGSGALSRSGDPRALGPDPGGTVTFGWPGQCSDRRSCRPNRKVGPDAGRSGSVTHGRTGRCDGRRGIHRQPSGRAAGRIRPWSSA